MATIKSLENRIIDLELQVARLSAQLTQNAPSRKKGILAMAGCMADYPEFEEVVRLGREWRKSQRWEPEDPPKSKKNGQSRRRRVAK